MTRAVRGAITVRENSREEIREASNRLLAELLRRNRIKTRKILSILFSVTADLTRMNPASAVREAGFSAVPLFCLQEARIDGSLRRVIRVLVTYGGRRWRKPVPVYLGEARALRPDLGEGLGP